jgi:hypothetical protein
MLKEAVKIKGPSDPKNANPFVQASAGSTQTSIKPASPAGSNKK